MSSRASFPAIIVTDHDPVYLELIQDILCEHGYPHVACLASGSAWSIIRRDPPGLVLVDISIQHPHAGWTMINKMRLYGPTAHIPVIICSTNSRLPQQKADRLEQLSCHFLEKPFRLEALLAKVVMCIGPPPPAG